MIGSIDSNLIAFFNRLQGVVPTRGTLLIRRIDAGAIDQEDWKTIRSMLLGARVKPGSVLWQLVEFLFKNGQDLDAALAELVPRMKTLGIEINAQNLPGVTPKELREYRKK